MDGGAEREDASQAEMIRWALVAGGLQRGGQRNRTEPDGSRSPRGRPGDGRYLRGELGGRRVGSAALMPLEAGRHDHRISVAWRRLGARVHEYIERDAGVVQLDFLPAVRP